MKFLSLFVILSLSLAQAKILNDAEKLADFQQLNLAVDSSYGPLHYKQKQRGLKLQDLRDKYQKEILATKTNVEYYHSMIRYISEYHDGHFGAVLQSDYKAELPVTTDLIDGKVLIDTVDRKKLSEKEFPFVKGDEVISVNGMPVMDLVNDLSRYLGSGTVLSEKRTGAQVLFMRSARRFPVPTGDVEIEVRRGTSNLIEKVKLTWIVTGTPFDEKMSLMSFKEFNKVMDYDSLSMETDLKNILGEERLERSFRCSGATRIAIPADAKVIMMDPFVAYYHPTEKGMVGYLRIPHYYFPNPAEAFGKYEYAVSVLEKNTVGLVIDQDHNCGGSIEFLHNILSLFISQPVQPMQFELLASKTEYQGFKKWLAETPTDTIDYKSSEKVLELMKDTWEKGEFLTPKTSISGEEFIFPNRYRYTKPIVMLIDELSGSGGDAFPALMGGYKRATLIGTQTGGLGGHVESLPALNHSGLDVRITKSLFYRPDGVPVENNGAIPDVRYTPTRDDFMYEYKNYQKFYLKTLLEKI